MNPELLTVFAALGLYAAAVVSPGPSVALVSRLSIAGSRSGALGAALGLAAVAAFYAALTMTGLALLLTRIGWLASLVQIAGGCYLIYLGVMTWLASESAAARPGPAAPGSFLRGLRTGVVVNLSNPKGIAFFIGLYAVAIPVETSFRAKLVILAGGFAMEVLWYGMLIALFSSRPAQAAYRRFGRWIERIIGTLLAAFGARLIAEKL